MDTWKEDKAVLRGEITTRIPFADSSSFVKKRGSIQASCSGSPVICFLVFFIIIIIIPLSVYKLIVNVRKPVLLWTTLYQCHPVTFLWRQLWRGWHLTPCWQRHREADLKKTIDAFSRTPLPSLSLRYIFSEIYLVTRPPDTIGYPAQQGNEWRALPEPAKCPGFYNVLVFPPVWEWIVGTVLNIKHRT